MLLLVVVGALELYGARSAHPGQELAPRRPTRALQSIRLLCRLVEIGKAEGEMMATPTPAWTPEKEKKLRELILGAKSVEAINDHR
jgi:hypothetical protein